MKFVPRTRKPDNGNKYYISSRSVNAAGVRGWNPCILGNAATTNGRDRYLTVLPNCVGWSVSRYNECVGKKNCNLLYIKGGNNNAKNLINNALKQGLEVGDVPKLGAVIVWADNQYGHVANVEQISADGKTIRVSQSGWNYNGINHMWFATHQIGDDGNWIKGTDYSWMKGKYKFRGFIYLPEEEEEEEVTQDQFNKMMETYLAERAERPAGNYAEAKDALKWAQAEGIIKGDDKGRLKPQSFPTREEVCIMLKRMK